MLMHRLALPVSAAILALAATAAAQRGPVTTRPGDPATLDEVNTQIDELNGQVDRITGQPGGSRVTTLHDMISELGKQREQLKIEIAGKQSREEVLQAKIQELTAKAWDQAKQDEMLTQLEKIADTKKAAAERTHDMTKAGVASASDESANIIDAAEAAVHVAERREAIIASVGGGALPALNKELLATSLDLNEEISKLKYIEKRMDELRTAVEISAQVTHLGDLRNLYIRQRSENAFQ